MTIAQPAHKRILLKLSGEALMGDDQFGINRATIVRMVEEIAEVTRLGVQVAVVIGGGNIFRGVAGGAVGMDRATADYMGMLATVMNSLALADAMNKAGLTARVMSAIGIDQRIHRLHHGTEGTAWQSIDGQLCCLSWFDLGLETLGQTEIDQHRVKVFDVDHIRAILEVIPHIHLAQTGDPMERRHDLQPLQARLGQIQLGLRHFQGRRTLIQRAFADEALRHQLLVAFVVRSGDRHFGFGL